MSGLGRIAFRVNSRDEHELLETGSLVLGEVEN